MVIDSKRAVEVHLGVLRCLVLLADAGHVGQRARLGLGVQALGVANRAHLDGSIDEHLEEIPVVEDLAGGPAICPERRDEGHDDHKPGFEHEFSGLGHAADILRSVLRGEAKVLVDAGANVVTIKHEGVHAKCEEAPLEGVGDRRLARSGQTRQPDHARRLMLQPSACSTG